MKLYWLEDLQTGERTPHPNWGKNGPLCGDEYTPAAVPPLIRIEQILEKVTLKTVPQICLIWINNNEPFARAPAPLFFDPYTTHHNLWNLFPIPSEWKTSRLSTPIAGVILTQELATMIGIWRQSIYGKAIGK